MGIDKVKKSKYDRERYLKNREKLIRYQKKRAYGLTDDQLDALGKVCEICGNPAFTIQYGKLRSLDIDHDHRTNKVRGVLCSDCNFGLGKFKDSALLLSCAIAYLWRHAEDDPNYPDKSIGTAFGRRDRPDVELCEEKPNVARPRD